MSMKNAEKNVKNSTKAEKRQRKRYSATAVFAGSVGMSNTHPTRSLEYERTVFVDYLKVRFHGLFNAGNELDQARLAELFRILKLNPYYYDIKETKMWRNFYEYDDGTAFMSSTDITETNTGPSHYLELKGQGCRAFELRGGDWIELLDYCVRNATMVNRIDLSLDDFTGNINMKDILNKVYSKSFTSDLRTWRINEGTVMYDEDPNILKSPNGGATVTFGTPKSKQLVIYNKVAERLARSFVVDVNYWIRYETRFFHETGVKVLQLAYDAMVEETFPALVSSLIKGLVDFKEDSIDIKKNRLETWDLWSELLDFSEALKVNNSKNLTQAQIESSLTSKKVWLAVASGRILSKAFLTNPKEFNNYIKFAVANALNKFDFVDLSQVNYLRKQVGEESLTMEQAMNMLEKEFADYLAPNEYLRKVLKAGDPFLEFDEESGEIYD